MVVGRSESCWDSVKRKKKLKLDSSSRWRDSYRSNKTAERDGWFLLGSHSSALVAGVKGRKLQVALNRHGMSGLQKYQTWQDKWVCEEAQPWQNDYELTGVNWRPTLVVFGMTWLSTLLTPTPSSTLTNSCTYPPNHGWHQYISKNLANWRKLF